jgi:hypothetical protein
MLSFGIQIYTDWASPKSFMWVDLHIVISLSDHIKRLPLYAVTDVSLKNQSNFQIYQLQIFRFTHHEKGKDRFEIPDELKRPFEGGTSFFNCD